VTGRWRHAWLLFDLETVSVGGAVRVEGLGGGDGWRGRGGAVQVLGWKVTLPPQLVEEDLLFAHLLLLVACTQYNITTQKMLENTFDFQKKNCKWMLLPK
jgi:hypothetical protein